MVGLFRKFSVGPFLVDVTGLTVGLSRKSGSGRHPENRRGPSSQYFSGCEVTGPFCQTRIRQPDGNINETMSVTGQKRTEPVQRLQDFRPPRAIRINQHQKPPGFASIKSDGWNNRLHHTQWTEIEKFIVFFPALPNVPSDR